LLEYARTYFNFQLDVASFDWQSFGDGAGRLGRKIEDAEAAKIKTIIVSEGAIMMHVEEDMQE
jgi:hypothetical protein